MLYNQPLVSICIPTYNAEKTVMSTLQSILKQTYHNLEIVIDDASTDNTLALLQEFNDPRMIIHKNDKNISAEQSYTQCIQLASGEYIAIFHADDLYQSDIVEKQVRAFQDSPAVGAVFTLARRINERGEVTGQIKLPVKLRGKRVYHFSEIFISILENGNFLWTPTCMVRGKLYKELAPFDWDRSRTAADLDMWLRVLEKHPIAILDEKLMSYRISNIQYSYRYGYLRTEQADFFRVMDYYSSAKADVLDVPRRTLNKYEFLRSIDNFRCAVNYLIKRQPGDAKRLLKESFSATVFRGAMGNFRRPELLAYWIFGMMLLGLVHLGLGRYLGRSLHWLLYSRWRRRLV